MTSGSMAYLVMCMAVFIIFAVVLAYQSWQQSRLGRDYVPATIRSATGHAAAEHDYRRAA